MSNSKDNDAYISAIKKTGFILENKIAEILKNNSWSVISNKYYEDDHSNSVREVDLVAYKVQEIFNCSLYTVLIISCKKSEENIWALLARNLNASDPNSNWWPLHAWSNKPSIHYQISKSDIGKSYHSSINKIGVGDALKMPDYEVFAFQELSKAISQKSKNNNEQVISAPRNDTAIFNSITSLMKAQAYEIGSLPNRKKSHAIYQFNLVTVAETQLLRMVLNDDEISCETINSDHYIGRYIINRKDYFSRIRFIESNNFENCIEDYNKLHKANQDWFKEQEISFYSDILTDAKRSNVLLPEFKKSLGYLFKYHYNRETDKELNNDNISVGYSDEKKMAYVYLDFDFSDLEKINNSTKMKEIAKKALASVYRYTGPFEFDFEIMF